MIPISYVGADRCASAIDGDPLGLEVTCGQRAGNAEVNGSQHRIDTAELFEG